MKLLGLIAFAASLSVATFATAQPAAADGGRHYNSYGHSYSYSYDYGRRGYSKHHYNHRNGCWNGRYGRYNKWCGSGRNYGWNKRYRRHRDWDDHRDRHRHRRHHW